MIELFSITANVFFIGIFGAWGWQFYSNGQAADSFICFIPVAYFIFSIVNHIKNIRNYKTDDRVGFNMGYILFNLVFVGLNFYWALGDYFAGRYGWAVFSGVFTAYLLLPYLDKLKPWMRLKRLAGGIISRDRPYSRYRY